MEYLSFYVHFCMYALIHSLVRSLVHAFIHAYIVSFVHLLSHDKMELKECDKIRGDHRDSRLLSTHQMAGITVQEIREITFLSYCS